MILSERPLLERSRKVLAGLLNSRPPMGHISHLCTDPHCFRGCPRLLEQKHWEREAEDLLSRLYVVLGDPEPSEERSIP